MNHPKFAPTSTTNGLLLLLLPLPVLLLLQRSFSTVWNTCRQRGASAQALTLCCVAAPWLHDLAERLGACPAPSSVVLIPVGCPDGTTRPTA